MYLKISTIFFTSLLVFLGNTPTQSDGIQQTKFNFKKPNLTNRRACNLNPNLISEIANYSNVANEIYKTILKGAFKGRTYNDLAYFVDTFGPRLTGSQNLENSIDFMIKKMRKDGIENVHGESLQVPHWVRGKETGKMILPREKNIAVLGLGLSVRTPRSGIRAEVLVVKTLEELKQNAGKAKGKIILFNRVDEASLQIKGFRTIACAESSKNEAVACLFRALTPFSLYTLHALTIFYDKNFPQIPSASITVEDSDLLQRIQDRDETIVMDLTLNDFNLLPRTSRNIIGEIKGREKPEEFVTVSGHIDSWDLGDGAVDDGGGAFVSVEALSVLRSLNLRPRRTLQAILWTGEEFGLYGIKGYMKRHKNRDQKISVAFETDFGTFKPLGLDFVGSNEAACIMREVMKLLAPVNATTFRKLSQIMEHSIYPAGTDIDELIAKGVPGVGLNTQNDRYFWYHHSEGDTLSVQNTVDLDLCTAVWTVASYVLADLSIALPRV